MDDEALPPVRYTATVLQFEICLPPTSLPIHTRPCLTVDYSAVSSSKYKKKTACRSSFWCPVPKASALPTTGLISRTVEGTKKKDRLSVFFLVPGAEGVGFADNGTDIKDCGGYKKKDRLSVFFLVPGTGLEPAHLSIHAPETCASTNSAIRALFVSGFFVCAQDKT